MADIRLQTMRSAVIGLVLVALCGGATAATQLQWKLPNGKTYYQRTMVNQQIVQSAMGQEMTVDQNIGLGQKLQVLDVDAQGNMRIQYTYVWARFKQSNPATQVDIDYDSSQQKPVPAGAESFAALIGQTYTIKMTPKGKILDVNGVEQLKQAVLKKLPAGAQPNPMDPTGAYMDKDSLRQMTEARMAIYPDKPVSPGESWSKDITMAVGFTMMMKAKWTLQKEEAGVATIASVVTVKTDPAKPMEMGGMKLNFDMSGTQEGTTRVAEATGLIVSSKEHQLLKGELRIGAPAEGQPAMSIPMSVDTNATEEMSDQMWKTGP